MSECPVSSGAREGSTGNSVYSSDHAGEGLSARARVCVCVCVRASTRACVCVTGASQGKGSERVSVCVCVCNWTSPGKGSERVCVGFDPWVGKIPWKREWQPPPVFLPEESHRQRSLEGCSPWGCKESDVTEHAHTCV